MNIFSNKIGYHISAVGFILIGIFLLHCNFVSAEACFPGTISELDSCEKVVGKAIPPPGLKEFLDGPGMTGCPNTHPTFHKCYSKDGKNYLCCENENAPAALKACDPETGVDGNYYLCASTQDCTKAGGIKVAELSGQNKCDSLICCQAPVSATSTPAAPTAPAAPKTYKLTNPLGEGQEDLRVIAGKVINTFLGIVGALALLVFVYAGLTYLIAGGNDQMVTKAKSTMKYGVIGVFLIMFSYAITDSFITLWTQDLPTSQSTDAPIPAELPTQAEQEVEDLLSQQQAATEAEAKAQATAESAAKVEKNTTTCATKTVNGELVPIRWCKVPANVTEASTCWSSGCSGSELCCP